ncbi:MAG: UPF0182 family protein [Actinobacteria bacterium]|nr:UPF0182 family protein [Actinomycetota bacterium]
MRDLLRRRLGIVIAVVLVVVLLSANRIATFLTDLWWYDALGYRGVFTGVLGAQVVLGLVFGVFLAVVVAANLQIARRLRPTIIPSTPQQAIVERYRQMADPYLPWLIGGLALLFGLTAGAAVSQQWESFLLWRNGGEFGVADPQFSRDVGFYVFDLPWVRFVQNWLFTSLILVGLLTAGAHYLLGGIRPEAPGDKVTRPVKVHLSVLLAIILAVRGWGYWLDRYMLNFSPRGQVTGASYTDVNAELPALYLLLVVTGVAIVLVLISIRRSGWLLPGAAIGLLVLASIVLSGAYPAVIQRVRVDPQELERESEFIDRNLEATRAAWGLEDIDFGLFQVTDDITEADLEEEQVTLANIRLWDPRVLETTYAELQALRPYYAFNDVDVDRYGLDGELRQVMLSARELDQSGLPEQAQTWQNQRLTFTHGFGAVASQINTTNPEGQPIFLARDIPPRGNPALVPAGESGIYFGERDEPSYSIVDTEQPELDYETSEGAEQVTTVYAGEGGVPLGNRLRRLAFSIRFADPNFVLSGLLNDDSKVIYHRGVRARVERVAPYLLFDNDPYPVILNERLAWIQDAYTHSDMYPYSERVDGFLGHQVNYLRNSVKAVVDAYDGTVTLYVVDENDPVVEAWRRTFPAPYADVEDAPSELAAHFRYPEDLFTIQARVYQTYHIPTTEAFYSKADAWDIPNDPSQIANQAAGQNQAAPLLRPYYLLMRLPGEADEEFVLIQPYLARNKPNMIAWLAGRSDPGHLGDLFAVQFPSSQTILGPQQAQARIEQDDRIAEYITLRDQAGSEVIRGNLLVIPIGSSILYVEPLFLESPQARIPQLERVVLVMGERVVFERTLQEALETLVTAPSPEEGEEEEEGEDLIELQERIAQAFQAAQDALEAGDLGGFQTQFERASELYNRLLERQGLAPEPEPTAGETPGTEPTTDATEPAPEATATASS